MGIVEIKDTTETHISIGDEEYKIELVGKEGGICRGCAFDENSQACGAVPFTCFADTEETRSGKTRIWVKVEGN